MKAASVVDINDMAPQAEIDVEARFGQLMIAFGKGVGDLWVERGTVTAIRQCYAGLAMKYARDPQFALKYERDAVQVLRKIETIGRVAALRATRDCRGTIFAEDFVEAERQVNIKGPTQHCSEVLK